MRDLAHSLSTDMLDVPGILDFRRSIGWSMGVDGLLFDEKGESRPFFFLSAPKINSGV